jgi:uncharacterized Zn finger protein
MFLVSQTSTTKGEKQMFILRSRQQLTKAIENARALHPKVRMVEFGEYEVTGSKGAIYTVLCYRLGGEKIVDCNCPSRVPCKHSAAALQVHVYMAARRGH